jgi:hypothetical protein
MDKNSENHIIPLVNQLQAPELRVYHNEDEPKPVRKLAKINIKFGDLTVQNLE